MAQIDSGLKSREADYAERIYRWQEDAIQRIAERLRLDGPERALERGVGIGPGLAPLANDLFNLRTRIANFGRGQLNEELKRQAR